MKATVKEKGLTLIEVMIALAIFSTFILVYMGTERNNSLDSTRLWQNHTLQFLTSSKLNEVLLNPPPLEKSLTLRDEKKNFEQEAYKEYTYTLKWRPLELGEDFHKQIIPESLPEDQLQAVRPIVKLMTKNIKEILWQVEVTVEGPTGEVLTMAGLTRKKKKKLDLLLGI